MKFLLNGCDISFYAEAPEDITLKQLLQNEYKIDTRQKNSKNHF